MMDDGFSHFGICLTNMCVDIINIVLKLNTFFRKILNLRKILWVILGKKYDVDDSRRCAEKILSSPWATSALLQMKITCRVTSFAKRKKKLRSIFCERKILFRIYCFKASEWEGERERKWKTFFPFGSKLQSFMITRKYTHAFLPKYIALSHLFLSFRSNDEQKKVWRIHGAFPMNLFLLGPTTTKLLVFLAPVKVPAAQFILTALTTFAQRVWQPRMMN